MRRRPQRQLERKNLAYVTHGCPSQTLDLYAPKKAKQVPLIVWIHGGAFLFGSKEGFPVEPVPLHFLLEGYAIASINYRLSPEALFPAQLEDCKAAIRWLRAHADEFGIDPNRIGAWGASAGGNLAALLGTTGEVREFEVGENLDYSSRVQAVCDFYGPTDFCRWMRTVSLTGKSTTRRIRRNRSWSVARSRITLIR